MSGYNPDTARTASAQSPAPDTQTIIGLLDGLMPLLLQLQSQFPGQSHLGQPGPLPPDFGIGFGNPATYSPMLDHQAARELVEDINAGALRVLSTYLENYANQHAALANCVPLVTEAARSFAARDQARAFAFILEAYRAITIARAIDTQLPPPRVAVSGPASQSASVLH